METTAPPSPILGADLRSLRHARGLTLQQLAGQLQRSVGWLSQVERDMSQLSVADLRRIARALDVPVSLLFSQADAPQHESGYVVRRTARRPIGTRIPGLVEELLSPDLTDDFEVVHSTFAPHSRLKKPTNRPTQELGFLVSGQLDITIAGHAFRILPGDSFRIRGEPFSWANTTNAPAVAIWVIAPPVY